MHVMLLSHNRPINTCVFNIKHSQRAQMERAPTHPSPTRTSSVLYVHLVPLSVIAGAVFCLFGFFFSIKKNLSKVSLIYNIYDFQLYTILQIILHLKLL